MRNLATGRPLGSCGQVYRLTAVGKVKMKPLTCQMHSSCVWPRWPTKYCFFSRCTAKLGSRSRKLVSSNLLGRAIRDPSAFSQESRRFFCIHIRHFGRAGGNSKAPSRANAAARGGAADCINLSRAWRIRKRLGAVGAARAGLSGGGLGRLPFTSICNFASSFIEVAPLWFLERRGRFAFSALWGQEQHNATPFIATIGPQTKFGSCHNGWRDRLDGYRWAD